MRKILIGLLCLVVIGLLILSCDDDKFVNPEPDDGKVTVSGRVMAYACGWFDPPFPYSQTGRQAIVRLISSTGNVAVAATDDSSRFSMVVDTGEYLVEIINWHSWPIILMQTYFSENTEFDPTFAFQFLFPDTVMCAYRYEVAEDSLGEDTERSQLETLDDYVGGMAVAEARRIVTLYGPGSAVVTYFVGLEPNKYVYQVCDEGNRIIRLLSNIFHDDLEVKGTDFDCFVNDDGTSRPVLISPGEAAELMRE